MCATIQLNRKKVGEENSPRILQLDARTRELRGISIAIAPLVKISALEEKKSGEGRELKETSE